MRIADVNVRSFVADVDAPLNLDFFPTLIPSNTSSIGSLSVTTEGEVVEKVFVLGRALDERFAADAVDRFFVCPESSHWHGDPPQNIHDSSGFLGISLLHVHGRFYHILGSNSRLEYKLDCANRHLEHRSDLLLGEHS